MDTLIVGLGEMNYEDLTDIGCPKKFFFRDTSRDLNFFIAVYLLLGVPKNVFVREKVSFVQNKKTKVPRFLAPFCGTMTLFGTPYMSL